MVLVWLWCFGGFELLWLVWGLGVILGFGDLDGLVQYRFCFEVGCLSFGRCRLVGGGVVFGWFVVGVFGWWV